MSIPKESDCPAGTFARNSTRFSAVRKDAAGFFNKQKPSSMKENFEGSILKTELTNAGPEKLKTFHKLIVSSQENNPGSAFWKNALEFSTAKMKKLKLCN